MPSRPPGAVLYKKAMKILHRYIGKSILLTIFSTVLVMIGVLCMGNLLKIADLITKGVDPFLLAKFVWLLIIKMMQYALPMAILTGTLLVFGRLSADNELTAMRASGIGLPMLTYPVFVLGFLLSILSLYLNTTVIPINTFAMRKLRYEFSLKDPSLLLEPGKSVKLLDYDISVQGKKGNLLKSILINQYEKNQLTRTVVAESASFISLDEDKGFILKLKNGTLEEYDRKNPQISTHTTFNELEYSLDLKAMYNEHKNVQKRLCEMTAPELIKERRILLREGAPAEEISEVNTEFQERLSLGVACLVFVFIGIPMAIQTHRGSKSIGMAMSLVLLFFFYIFILYAEGVADCPGRYPHLVVWLPNVLYAGLGIFLITKYTQI